LSRERQKTTVLQGKGDKSETYTLFVEFPRQSRKEEVVCQASREKI